MQAEIKIGDRLIGSGHPVFIIAEGGVDHKGNISEAKRLIDKAKEVGADAIKFQTYRSDKLVTKDAKCYWHLAPGDNPSVRQIDTFRDLDKLPRNIYKEIIEYGKQKGIIVFSTPFDEDAIDVLVEAGVPAIKIASTDIVCHPLLKKAAQTGLPILMSTGAATYEEIDNALEVIKGNGGSQIGLLHCILDYPTADKYVNLRAIKGYKKRYGIPIGYSDHTLTVPPGVLAVAHGASFVEKHVTGDKFEEKQGKPVNPDASFMSFSELKSYIDEIRKLERGEIDIDTLKTWAGDKIEQLSGLENPRRPLMNEIVAWQEARRSLVTTREIKKGETISLKDLDWKRPGTGLLPTFKNINYIIGRKILVDIPQDSIIFSWMIDNS